MGNEPNKPNFSNVQGGSSTTSPKADFSSVQAGGGSTAQVVQSTASTNKPEPTTYTVAKGDSLSKIAKHLYGDANKWKAIFEANKDTIKDPDLIHPGQVLKLPTGLAFNHDSKEGKLA